MSNSNSNSVTQMQTQFVFPSAYGGAIQSANPPQIHDLMRALRIEIGAVEAVKSQDKFGPKFPVRGAKDLAQKLANALNKLNMEAPVVAQEITFFETDKIPGNERQSGNPVFRTLAHVKATVRLIAPDTSFIEMVGSGHGGDVDDKSGGKASTYAWKDAILKGLSIPHEDMVDTDDDSSTGGAEGGAGRAGGRETRTRGAGESRQNASRRAGGGGEGSVGNETMVEQSEAPSDEKGLAYVVAKIAAANTDADLESIRAAIKSGVLALHGADRLNATKAWMERKKELDV